MPILGVDGTIRPDEERVRRKRRRAKIENREQRRAELRIEMEEDLARELVERFRED